MRLGIAKIDQQAIAQVLGNVPVEALDDLCRGGLVGSYHLTVVFGVQLPGETGRVHQVAEQHGELPAFRLRGARCAGGGLVLRGWRGCASSRTSPDQAPAVFVGHRVVGVEEFFLQIRKRVVVQVELALEGPIRDAATLAQQCQDLIEDGIEVHAHPSVSSCMPSCTCASAASAWGIHKVMSMARYSAMAVVSSARAGFGRSVLR